MAGDTTDAFNELRKIADKGIIAFCEEALGFEPAEYQRRFLEETQ
jgi:hypothetical protein